jgi:hypothetical protein
MPSLQVTVSTPCTLAVIANIEQVNTIESSGELYPPDLGIKE